MTALRNSQLQEIANKISCIYREITARQSYPFDSCSLTKPQIDILFLISQKKSGISVKELAGALNVTSGAITQFLNELVEKKLVIRQEDSNDRRVLNLTLSVAAQEKFAAFKKDYFESVSPAFEGLSDAELSSLLVLLNKIVISSTGKTCHCLG